MPKEPCKEPYNTQKSSADTRTPPTTGLGTCFVCIFCCWRRLRAQQKEKALEGEIARKRKEQRGAEHRRTKEQEQMRHAGTRRAGASEGASDAAADADVDAAHGGLEAPATPAGALANYQRKEKSHDSEGGALINTRLVFPNPHQGLLSPPRPEDQLLAQFTREELAGEEGHQSSVALKEERRKIWEERRVSSTKTEQEREREGSEE